MLHRPYYSIAELCPDVISVVSLSYSAVSEALAVVFGMLTSKDPRKWSPELQVSLA
jgi:hypothetical protein